MSVLRRRRTFIHLALSLMTASWLSGILVAFWGDAGPPLPVTVGVLTMLTMIPLELSRWVRQLNLRRDLRRGVLAGVFAFLALLVVSAGFYNDYGLFGRGWMTQLLSDELSSGTFLNQSTSLLLVALCWWLGHTLGDRPLTSSNLLRYFYVCILAQVLPSIFFATDVSQNTPWLFFVFLFAALVMLELGRVEEAARRSQDTRARFTGYWLAQAGMTAAVILSLVGVAHASGLARGFGLILVVVAPIITLLLYPLAFLGAKIGAALLTPLVSQITETAGAPDQVAAGGQPAQAFDPNSTGNVCLGLVILVFSLLVLAGIMYGTRRWRELMREQDREERAALPSLGQQLSHMVEEQLERLGFNLPGMGRLRRRMATRSIRRIYAALLALAAERGYPRMAARTPYEHMGALRRAFPGCEVQVEQITEAYIAAHYGQAPESREALQEIKTAWEQVRETARRTAPLSVRLAEETGRA